MCKKSFVFILIKVWNIFICFFFPETTLTAVTGDKLSASAEFVDSQKTVVCTAFTAGHRTFKLQIDDVFQREHGSLFTAIIMFSGDQGCAESTHNTGDIRAYSVTAGNPFKTAQYGIIVECSALYYYIFTKVFGIGKFNNF